VDKFGHITCPAAISNWDNKAVHQPKDLLMPFWCILIDLLIPETLLICYHCRLLYLLQFYTVACFSGFLSCTQYNNFDICPCTIGCSLSLMNSVWLCVFATIYLH
jgi:hypothetical protein